MSRTLRTAALAILWYVVAVGSARAQAHFTARLDGPQEVPSVSTAARGTTAATLTSLGLHFFITVEGLSGPITGADIDDAATGVSGPAVRSILAEFAGANSAAVAWTPSDASPLTPALIAELMAGNLNVNVRTAAHPGGEIRGQLRLSAGAHLTANLRGTQENPSNASTGTGTGSFTLTEQGLHYKITANGLTGAKTAAHIHSGGIHVNGAVAFDILPSFAGNTATGTVQLSATQRKDVLAGNMYVNVHTAANPGGEIRGQISPAGGIGLNGALDPFQEVPPIGPSSNMEGTVSATLTSLGLVLRFSVNGSLSGMGPITAATLEDAAAGAVGPVVRTLGTGEFLSASTALVLWRNDDAEPLTPALVSELLKGNIYLNLRTAAHPSGEARAQLNPMLPTGTPMASFTAAFDGAQENPANASTAHATANLVLTAAGLRIQLTHDVPNPTAAHVHTGAISVNGAVVIALPVAFNSVGTYALTDAQITDLLKGNMYMNIHSSAFPGGEIRGQILPASGAEFEVRLTEAQETPPTGAAGTGTGSFTLVPQGLRFDVTFDGLSGSISAAHFHNAGPGVAGGVVRAIAAGEFATGNTLSGVWKPGDANALTPALVTELLKGNLYMNAHTAAFPGGEVRGQVVLSGGDGRDIRLSGTTEVPPVATPGRGTASLTLTDEGLVFRLSANDLQGAFMAGHIHEAPYGVNGGVVRDVTPEFTALTGDGVWKPVDASPLTDAHMAAYARDETYMNIHTTPHPGGEIRGQARATSALAVGPAPPSAAGLELAALPNPVGDAGMIRFRLPHAARVRLAIYDVTGAWVATLSEGPASPGWHAVPFETRRWHDGVYFSRLRVEGAGEIATKLLVIR